MLTYTKHAVLSLKSRPEYNEAWLRDRITTDPTILGLGDVEVRDIERILPSGGRLDVLLVDPERETWYEVELMLGTVDESHIIRTIEYWDIERKRYPQYDHVAVLVAENITTRFLNVISLFNNAIPLIAMQMNALEVEGKILLHFTKVLDVVVPGADEPPGPQVNPSYWEKKAPQMLPLVDECFAILQRIAPQVQPRYTKSYIGVIDPVVFGNFMVFRPRQGSVRLSMRVSAPQQWVERLEDAGIINASLARGDRLRFSLGKETLAQQRELLAELFAACYGATEE